MTYLNGKQRVLCNLRVVFSRFCHTVPETSHPLRYDDRTHFITYLIPPWQAGHETTCDLNFKYTEYASNLTSNLTILFNSLSPHYIDCQLVSEPCIVLVVKNGMLEQSQRSMYSSPTF